MDVNKEKRIEQRLKALINTKGKNIERLGKKLKVPGKTVPVIILIDDHQAKWAVYSDGTKGAISEAECQEARKRGAEFTLILPDILEA